MNSIRPLTLAFWTYLLANVVVIWLSLNALVKQPILVDAQGKLFQYYQFHPSSSDVTHIADVPITGDFFRPLPEGMNSAQEQDWWHMHRQVYQALSEQDHVKVIINNQVHWFNVETPGWKNFNRGIMVSYLASFLYVLMGIRVYLRRQQPFDGFLSLYLLAGPLFVLSANAVIERSVTLPPGYFRGLMIVIFASITSLLVGLQFAVRFPSPLAWLTRFKRPVFPVAHFIGVVMLAAYCLELLPFMMMPVTAVVIFVSMMAAFAYGGITENDAFVRTQCRYLLFACIAILTFYFWFFAPDFTFHAQSTGFSHYPILLLAMYFVLIHGCANIRLYRQRIIAETQRLQEREQYREIFHDNMLNKLAHIRLLTEMALTENDIKQDLPRVTRDHLEAIQKHTGAYSQKARGLLWITDDNCQQWTDFVTQLRRYGYDVTQAYPVIFSLEFIEERSMPSIPSLALKMGLYHIFVEAISNALQHSKAQHITVLMQLNASEVALICRDDGLGLPQQTPTTGHYGLYYMERRARDLGGDCTIDSESKNHKIQGTVVHTTLPLSDNVPALQPQQKQVEHHEPNDVTL